MSRLQIVGASFRTTSIHVAQHRRLCSDRVGPLGKLRIPVVLLPGLDGTGKLFKRFAAAAPAHVSLMTAALPAEPLAYDELADRIAPTLPAGEPPVLIAESFSGPLAVRIAEHRRVGGIVFCNSFISAPRSQALRWLALPPLLRLRAPALLLRRYMLGPDAGDELVREVADAVASVPATVLASRIRIILEGDEASAFERCDLPMLYLRGTEDRLVSEQAWRRMAALRPIPLAQIAGPHLLLQASPAAAWAAVLPFLASLPA